MWPVGVGGCARLGDFCAERVSDRFAVQTDAREPIWTRFRWRASGSVGKDHLRRVGGEVI